MWCITKMQWWFSDCGFPKMTLDLVIRSVENRHDQVWMAMVSRKTRKKEARRCKTMWILLLRFAFVFLRVVQFFDYFACVSAWIMLIAMELWFGLWTIFATATGVDFFVIVMLVFIDVSCWRHVDFILLLSGFLKCKWDWK